MGHSFACVQLAAKYLNGGAEEGVKKNLELAAKYYQLAAELGNPLALHKLGMFCEQGGLKGTGISTKDQYNLIIYL
jgi:TPR repeat protein